jgi:V/A-type H+/Na+-transporting ATPase subunit E
MAEQQHAVSGVQKLIDRLRNDGVKAGQEHTRLLLKEAQEKADKILADAKAEAERLCKEAQEHNAAERVQTLEALRLAARNTEQDLENGLRRSFESHVKRLVSKEVQDENFLRQLLLAIVGLAPENIPADQAVEVLLPEGEGMKNFVRSVTKDMLREGVDLKPSNELNGGIKVKLKDENVELDFSEHALSNLILKHLLPRYRAIMQGVE